MELPATFVKGFHDEASVRKMEYRRLGKTDLMVSKLSLGGGALAPLYGDVNEADAVRAIQAAIRSGINYIDTAPFYGQGKSERIIGKALKDIPRQAYYIATKVGRYGVDMATQFDFTSKKIKEGFHQSLEYLGLEYVDIIQVHDVEFAESVDFVVKESIEALKEFVRNGKARFIGVTGYPLNVLKEVIERSPETISVVLSYARYTLFDDSLMKYLPFFKEHDLGVICAAGFGMGLLTNGGPQPWHPAASNMKATCKKAADYCKSKGVDLARLALYYHLQLEEPSTFLVGMQSSVLLQANLDTCFIGLNEKELQVLEYLKQNIFTSSMHWEGLELEKYNQARKE